MIEYCQKIDPVEQAWGVPVDDIRRDHPLRAWSRSHTTRTSIWMGCCEIDRVNHGARSSGDPPEATVLAHYYVCLRCRSQYDGRVSLQSRMRLRSAKYQAPSILVRVSR